MAIRNFIISIVLAVSCAGCATPHYYGQRSYAVDGFELVVMDRQVIQRQYRLLYGRDLPGIHGYCDQKARVLFVARDIWHPDRPMFECLGHEVWHLFELGGNFHDTTRR